MKTIEDFNLKGKKVIIRVDFNVPIKDNKILDDNRIIMSLDTIRYAIKKEAKVILLSHLGRVKSIDDMRKNSLKIIIPRLSELLKKQVIFSPVAIGRQLEDIINNMSNCDVVLVENTRFLDLDGKLESSNDINLGKYWASLGDIFINDAFATAHRSHASNVGIATNLPHGIGFLMKKELDILTKVKNNPKRPYTVILGGAKVKDKIGVINSLVNSCDYILIGGGMSYSFLEACGYNVGSSLLDNESYDYCKNLLERYQKKIILPLDVVVCKEIKDNCEYRTCDIDSIENSDIGVDVGPKTIELFKKYILNSNMVVWNGTLGCYEYDAFARGTKNMLEILKNSSCDTIICGGDTASAAINFGYKNAFKHISTGGGASLELLEGKKLPSLSIDD